MAGVLLVAVWLMATAAQGRDMQTLSYSLNEAIARQELLENHPKQVKDAVEELNSLWEEFALGKELGRVAAVSPLCLETIANFTFNEKDAMNLPLIVDLIDAGGKPGAGILVGNFFVDGAYDECLDLDAPVSYCVAPIFIPLLPPGLSVRTGVCLPSVCSPNDLASFLDEYLGNGSVNPAAIQCQDSKTKPYHWTAVAMLCYCCVLGAVIILSTLADLLISSWKQRKVHEFLGIGPTQQAAVNSDDNETDSEDKPLLSKSVKIPRKSRRFDPVEWVQAFSLYKTIPTILSTKQTSAAIRCLNGIRVISMFWVILGHVHLVVLLAGLDNQSEITSILGRFSFQAVGNAYFSVDSFFLLSGVLLAYLTFRQMKRRNGKFPFAMFYIHRYLRLTPVYAFVLFFTWWLGMHLADGPYFTELNVGGAYWNTCNKYWWTNLLYINNLYPWELTESCLDWSWYLANDMQFFVISPLILIPLYFLVPVGLVVTGGLLVISFITTAILAGVFDLQSTTFAGLAYHYVPPHNYSESLSNDLLYIKPWHRIQPYLVGLVLGYLLFRQVKVPFNRYFKLGSYLIMWCLAIIFCMSTVYGLYGIWHGHVPSLGENIIYLTFSRFTWGVGLALLVFICHNGYGGWVNSFLSWSVWTPLSRLTFNAYLVHPVVVLVLFTSVRKSMHYMDLTMAFYAVSCTVLSFGIAFILAVCVEFPFGNLEMAFFKLFGVGARESTRADTEAQEKVRNAEGIEHGELEKSEKL